MTKTACSNLFKFLFYCIIFIVFISIFLSIKLCRAEGTIIYVDASNIDAPWNGTITDPYKTIKAGIQNASTGGTVLVKSGTYYENLVIEKNLTLTGENMDTTIIDGRQLGRVVYAVSTNTITVNISGFTIENAGDTYSCIAFSHVSSATILGNKLMNVMDIQKSKYGIQLDHCSGITIANNQILNNPSAGISISVSTQNKIYENTFQSNLIGIQFSMSSNYNTLYNNTFMKNTQYQAKDPCNNYWDYNGRGNYWDDYTGFDVNPKDGIGDAPYNISGGSNQDHYPLGFFKNTESTPPEAYIDSITPNSATSGQLISFRGHGYDPDGGNIVRYKWRSSIDGLLSNSTEGSFGTSSLSIGTHTIYFSVQDDEGDWSIEKPSILTITQLPEHIKPIAVIDSIIPTQTAYGERVSFIGHGLETHGSITAYKWVSSLIGVLSNHSSFNRSDLPVGTHNISFQVMDALGNWSAPVPSKLIISPKSSSTNKPPVAHADGPSLGMVNTSFNFTGSTSYDPDGTIVSYQWDFGDEQIESGISVNHIYTRVGNYTVILTVTDNNESQTTDSLRVTITTTGGQTNHQGNEGNGSLLSWFNKIPIIIITLILGVLIFIIIIALFFHKMKHS